MCFVERHFSEHTDLRLSRLQWFLQSPGVVRRTKYGLTDVASFLSNLNNLDNAPLSPSVAFPH